MSERNLGARPSPSFLSNAGVQTGPSVVPGLSNVDAIAGSIRTMADVSAQVGVACPVGHADPIARTCRAVRDVTVVRGVVMCVVNVDTTCGAPWTTAYAAAYGGFSGERMVVGYSDYI